MATSIKYVFLSATGADIVDLGSPIAEYTLAGQEVSLVGSSTVNYVKSAAGVTVNVAALLGGEDIVLFGGNWADYSKDIGSVSGAIVFTRSTASGTESVTVGNGAIALTKDLLVFADGNVRSDNAKAALTSSLVATSGALGANWDAGTVIPGLDTTAPSLSISDDTAGTANGPLLFTFSFSEAVSGFAIGDIVASAGTLSGFSKINDSTYSVLATPPANLSGSLNLTVAAGAVTDLAGNANGAAASIEQAFDTMAPAPTLTIQAGQDATLNASESGIDLELSYAGMAAGDVVQLELDGADFGAAYTITAADVTAGQAPLNVAKAALGADGAKNVTAQVTDAAQNSGSSATLALTLDSTAPVLASISPADNAMSFDPASNLTLSFGEAIALGASGSITLKGLDGAADVVIDVANHGGQLSVAGDTLSINPTSDLVAGRQYAVQLSAGAVTDAAGNAYAGIGDATTLNFSTATSSYVSPAGQSVIDLGSYGKLILPVQVDGGRWYYYWDRSGDGTSANSGSLNGGNDYVNHDVLDGLFTQDINGNLNPGADTDNTYRYATLSGVKLALPTHGESTVVTGSRPGTAIDNDPVGEVNDTYDDLLAIWDAHNGAGTATGAAGLPSGWADSGYWSATPSALGHVLVGVSAGSVDNDGDSFVKYIALEVL